MAATWPWFGNGEEEEEEEEEEAGGQIWQAGKQIGMKMRQAGKQESGWVDM